MFYFIHFNVTYGYMLVLWHKNRIVPSGNASVGSDAMGKCGTWACGLLDGLDMEDSEDTREKETLISSYIIVAAEVRQSNAIVGFFLVIL